MRAVVNNDRQLCQSCYGANLRGIKEALDNKADASYNGGQPLFDTIRGKGDIQEKQDIIKILKKAGTDLNIRDGIALEWAASQNNLALVNFLIREGVDASKDGGLAILCAAQQGNLDILNILYKNRAKLEPEVLEVLRELDCMKDSDSPIKIFIDEKFVKIEEPDKEAEENLVDSALALPALDRLKQTMPTHIPVDENKGESEEVEASQNEQNLIEYAYRNLAEAREQPANNDQEEKNKDHTGMKNIFPPVSTNSYMSLEDSAISMEKGETTESLSKKLSSATESGQLAEVKRYISKGADVNWKNGYGWSVLMQAARSGHVDIANTLLSKRADITFESSKGFTAFDLAIQNNHTEVVVALLKTGQKINLEKEIEVKGDYRTPLMLASGYGCSSSLYVLLAYGANVNKRNRKGWDAAMLAKYYNRHYTTAVLLAYMTPEEMEAAIKPVDYSTLPEELKEVRKYYETYKAEIAKLSPIVKGTLSVIKIEGWESFKSFRSNIGALTVCKNPWGTYTASSAITDYILSFLGIPQRGFFIAYPGLISGIVQKSISHVNKCYAPYISHKEVREAFEERAISNHSSSSPLPTRNKNLGRTEEGSFANRSTGAYSLPWRD